MYNAPDSPHPAELLIRGPSGGNPIMNSLRCIVGEKEIRAAARGSGTILLRASAGVLMVVGSTREHPVRGFQLSLTGTEQRSKFQFSTFTWFDDVLPADTPVRVWLENQTSGDPPERRDPEASPEFVEREFRKKFEQLDRHFSKRRSRPLPPPPAPGEPVPSPECSHCLSIRRNGELLGTIGASGSVHAILTLNVHAGDASTCQLALQGYDGKNSLGWGEFNMTAGDCIDIHFEQNAVPDPLRLVPLDPHLAERFAADFHKQLSRDLRGKGSKPS
jgi:hypothetical protein